MNTFSTEYMSTVPVGITSNVVKSFPRSVQVPIKPKFKSKKNAKKINELKNTILKLADLISNLD